MKRLLGAWTLEGHDSKNSKPETGELIIDSTVKAEAKCSKVHSFAVAEIFMVIRL